MSRRLHAVALMGATGTGKSRLAMRVAAMLRTSIVCCDSMQVYCGLDIGTAKPTLEERRRIKHFLVDCCRLPDRYSAARWAAEARKVILAENEQGRKPLVVGGTGLYLRALLQGLSAIPPEKPEVRRRLTDLQRSRGTPYLHQMLSRCDPAMAERLKANDTQRIVRALSVYQSTGVPLSEWQARRREAIDIDCPVFVLQCDRKLLRERLAERFYAMLDAGWLEEARWLDALRLPTTHPAVRAVGYRQLLEYLHGMLTLDEAIEKGITATRRYAKRQVTWFRHQQPDALFGEAGLLEEKILEALA